MPTIAYCTECGVGIEPGFAFCPECGKRLPTPAAQAAPASAPKLAGDVTRVGRPANGADDVWEDPAESPWDGYGVDPGWPSAKAAGAGRATRGTTGRVIPATFGRRLMARLVDTGILVVIELAALAVAMVLVVRPGLDDGEGVAAAFSALILYLVWPLLGIVPTFVYFAWSESRGATVGKRAVGIRVETTDGEPLAGGRSLRRTLANTASGLLFGIPQLAMIWDKRRLTWPDRWSGTRVVRVTPASERFPSAGAGPLVTFAILVFALMLGLPALVLGTGASTHTADPGGTDPTTTVAAGNADPGPTTPTSTVTAGTLIDPCELVTAAEVRSSLGVSARTGELGTSEPKRLPDGRSIQSRGRQKCTFALPSEAVTQNLYQTPAFLVFTEQYTTEAGATAAFANFRDIARSRVLADTAPFGPVGDTSASRGFSEQLSVGAESVVYWTIARWSASDPTVTSPTTADPFGPTPLSRSEIGYFGLEFRVGTTCVVVALPGRFGSPADFPAIQRDAVPRLRELGQIVAAKLKTRS